MFHSNSYTLIRFIHVFLQNIFSLDLYHFKKIINTLMLPISQYYLRSKPKNKIRKTLKQNLLPINNLFKQKDLRKSDPAL